MFLYFHFHILIGVKRIALRKKRKENKTKKTIERKEKEKAEISLWKIYSFLYGKFLKMSIWTNYSFVTVPLWLLHNSSNIWYSLKAKIRCRIKHTKGINYFRSLYNDRTIIIGPFSGLFLNVETWKEERGRDEKNALFVETHLMWSAWMIDLIIMKRDYTALAVNLQILNLLLV